MDFVKREECNGIDEESYKAYMESLQKSHQIETMEYQHTPISVEQLHQAMQSSLNTTSIIHNFQLPLSPRQMSTLMLKTNLSRNFAEIPAHISRNLELELPHLANELPQNLRHDDFAQNFNRNLDITLARQLGNEIDLQNGLAHVLVQNLSEDLRINDVNLQQSLRHDLPHDLSHEIDLSHHLNRQNLEQEMLQEERRNSMVIHLPDSHLSENLRVDQNRIDTTLIQRLDQNIAQRIDQNNQRIDNAQRNTLEQNLSQRIDQSVVQRLDQIEQRLNPAVIQRLDQIGQRLDPAVVQRLDQIGQRLDPAMVQRLDQIGQRLDPAVVQRLDQIGQRLDPAVVQRLDQIGQRLDVVQRLDQIGHRLDQVGQRLDPRLVNALSERQLSQNDHVLPMQFHIKAEQEDDSYFYENINQGIGNVDAINGTIQTEQSQPAIQNDTQMYSVYPPISSVPALNPIDLYRTPNYTQNYVNRDNPQNLVVHRQYDNNSPYQEVKKRQDSTENVKEKSEEPKENLKPTDQNKIYEIEKREETKLAEELSMNIKGEYACYKCNEIFASKRGLKQHAKACTETEDAEKVGKFSCTQCAYRCQSPAILKIHERTHSGEKPFSCNFCDYKSGQKNNVAKHILVHMKEKPFRCQYCDYRCAQKNNLVVHERTHTGFKPFACPYCDYRTVQKPNLVKHMYLHTDQKPFSCDVCSYRCVQKTNLTKHKQRHLNDKDAGKIVIKDQKPYRPRQKSVKCTYCPYRCVQKSSMDKHMQFKHAGLEFNTEAFDQGLNLMKDDDVQNLSVKKDFAPVLEEPLIQS